ncbi:MAG: immune inhibitor A, partial [Anaerolineales bacterium]|nr:immune inhibitor A [Anaerolineales bacterium]
DLTPYIGTENLLVRFAYVTDDAVQNPGFAVDDIRIDALGFVDDVESAEAAEAWTAVGFVRHGNVLPQNWLVQQILLPSERNGAVQVSQIPLNALQQGTWTVPLGEGVDEAIIVVSGMNPVALSPATYAVGRIEN